MAAMPMEDPVTPILIITEKMSLALRLKEALVASREATRSFIGRAASWFNNNVLGRAAGYLRTALSWVSRPIAAAAGWVGMAGGIGLGLLSVSTGSGRWVLRNTIGRIYEGARWVLSHTLRTLAKGLNHLWTPGRWLAKGVNGLCNQAARGEKAVITTWWQGKVVNHLKTDGKAMRSIQAIGILFITFRLVQLCPWWPVSVLIVIVGVFAAFIVSPVSDWLDARILKMQRASATKKGEHVTVVGETIKDEKVTPLHTPTPAEVKAETDKKKAEHNRKAAEANASAEEEKAKKAYLGRSHGKSKEA